MSVSDVEMGPDFPSAVPEIPVRDIDEAAEYYEKNLDFQLDWAVRMEGLRASRKDTADSS